MNTTKNRKRLALDTETVRVLQADELTPVLGGAAGGWPAISLTISIGNNCGCCNTKD